MDSLSATERSERMRLIRSENTGPEMLVRHLTHKLGYRFRLHGDRLPGKPDLVFPSRHKAIFVHGCFWHRHNHCGLARTPKSRLEFWIPKLENNKLRDALKRRALSRLGWSSLVIWECELRDPAKLMIKILVFLEN